MSKVWEPSMTLILEVLGVLLVLGMHVENLSTVLNAAFRDGKAFLDQQVPE